MTPAQIIAFRAALLAETDPAIVAARDTRNDTETARLYNLPSTFIVWKTMLSRLEAMGDGFDWTQVDNLTNGQARIWDYLFDNNERMLNPSDPSQRAAISECWKGTGAKVANATFVLGQSKGAATVGEKVFATGTGTTQTPGTYGSFTGDVTTTDVGRALNG
jgi:hypothetical protein